MRLVLTKLQPLRARISAGRSAILNGRTFLIKDLEDINIVLLCLDEAIEKRIPKHDEPLAQKYEPAEPLIELLPEQLPEPPQETPKPKFEPLPIKTRRRSAKKG